MPRQHLPSASIFCRDARASNSYKNLAAAIFFNQKVEMEIHHSCFSPAAGWSLLPRGRVDSHLHLSSKSPHKHFFKRVYLLNKTPSSWQSFKPLPWRLSSRLSKPDSFQAFAPRPTQYETIHHNFQPLRKFHLIIFLQETDNSRACGMTNCLIQYFWQFLRQYQFHTFSQHTAHFPATRRDLCHLDQMCVQFRAQYWIKGTEWNTVSTNKQPPVFTILSQLEGSGNDH